MIASSTTFRPHLGRGIRDLFRMAHAVLHGTEALVYSNYPREATASTCLAIIFWPIASGIPWFFLSTAVPMQLLHRCRPCQYSVTVSADTDVGRGSLKQPAIKCLTLGLSCGMNRVTLSYSYSGDYPTRE